MARGNAIVDCDGVELLGYSTGGFDLSGIRGAYWCPTDPDLAQTGRLSARIFSRIGRKWSRKRSGFSDMGK